MYIYMCMNHSLSLSLFLLRFMLGLAGISSVIMFVGFLFMPESPRWLVFHGKPEKAQSVLYKLRDPSQVVKEMEEIQEDYYEYKKSQLGM